MSRLSSMWADEVRCYCVSSHARLSALFVPGRGGRRGVSRAPLLAGGWRAIVPVAAVCQPGQGAAGSSCRHLGAAHPPARCSLLGAWLAKSSTEKITLWVPRLSRSLPDFPKDSCTKGLFCGIKIHLNTGGLCPFTLPDHLQMSLIFWSHLQEHLDQHHVPLQGTNGKVLNVLLLESQLLSSQKTAFTLQVMELKKTKLLRLRSWGG